MEIDDKFNFTKESIEKKERKFQSYFSIIKNFILRGEIGVILFFAIVFSITFPQILRADAIHHSVGFITKTMTLPRNTIENYLQKNFTDVRAIKNDEKITYHFKLINKEIYDIELTITNNEKTLKILDLPINRVKPVTVRLKETIENIKEFKHTYKDETEDISVIQEF